MKIIFDFACLQIGKIKTVDFRAMNSSKYYQCVCYQYYHTMTTDIIMLKTKLQSMSEFPQLNINGPR